MHLLHTYSSTMVITFLPKAKISSNKSNNYKNHHLTHVAFEPKGFLENKINFVLNSYLKATKIMKFVFVSHIFKLLRF